MYSVFRSAPPKRAVGDHVDRHRNRLQEFAALRDHVNAGFVLVGSFVRRCRIVQPSGNVQPSGLVDCHPVGPSVAAPIEEFLLAAWNNVAVLVQLEPPKRSRFALVVIRIDGHKEMFVVGRNGDPVGSLDLCSQNPFHLSVGRDSIDAFDGFESSSCSTLLRSP